jgi:hypothetical protein
MNPSLLLIPDRYKAAKLYSQIPDSGAGDLTFARNSNATRVNSAGLIEKVRTNLSTYSEDFANAAWSPSDITVTSNTQLAPNGTTTADVVMEGTGIAQHRFQKTLSLSSSFYTFSVYVKNISGTRQAYIDLGPVAAYFTFSTETIYTPTAFASVQNVGSGWYRITLSNLTAISITSIYLGLATGNSETYTGNGTSSIAFWGAQVETGDIATDYIPTTTAAVSVGITADIPRLDYTGGGCPSLLLEPQRTNLVTFSESVTTSVTNVGYTATSNVATSPDGFASADLLLEDTSTLHLLQKEFSVASTTDSYAVSFFVKANGRTSGRILYGLDSAPFSSVLATFNLTAGTITAPSADAPAVAGTSKIENYGNGWYRVSISGVMGTAGTHYVRIQDNNGGVAGDPTKGFQVWGFQAELGSYATSYIPTLGSSVTRLADAASKTGISSLIGQTAGTVYLDVDITNTNSESGNWHVLVIGSTTERITVYTINNSINADGVSVGGGFTAIVGNVTLGRNKIAIGYAANDVAFYVNGALIGTRTTATIPSSMAQIDVGGNFTFSDYIAANTFSTIALYPVRLSNSELASLTSL